MKLLWIYKMSKDKIPALKGNWAITQDAYEHIQSVYGIISTDPTKYSSQLGFDNNYNFDNESDLQEDISNNIIRIVGPLFKSQRMTNMLNLFGEEATSYEQIKYAISRMDTSRPVRMYIDSPGGMVQGMESVLKALMSLRQETYIESICDIAYSAAYTIASQSNVIYAVNKMSAFGSIAVLGTFRRTPEELKPDIITAQHSRYKAPNASTPQGRAQIGDFINDTEKILIDYIAEGRGVDPSVIIASYGQGDVYHAEESIERGIVDGMFEENLDIGMEDNNMPNTLNAAPVAAVAPQMSAEQIQALAIAGAKQELEKETALKQEMLNAGIKQERARATALLAMAKTPEGRDVANKAIVDGTDVNVAVAMIIKAEVDSVGKTTAQAAKQEESAEELNTKSEAPKVETEANADYVAGLQKAQEKVMQQYSVRVNEDG